MINPLLPAAAVQLSPGEDQRPPREGGSKGGRVAAAGGGHRARPGRTRQAEDLRGA